MEVGDGGWFAGQIEPLERGLDIVVEELVLLLLAQAGTEKLGEEECQSGLDGREGQIGIIIIGAHIVGTREFPCIGFQFRAELHHRQGLPERHAPDGTLGTRCGGHERLASMILREEINNQ